MEKFKSIVDRPQASDMGDGFGHYEVAPGSTLKEFLKWFKENCMKELKIEIMVLDYKMWR